MYIEIGAKPLQRSLEVERCRQKVLDGLEGFAVRLRIIRDRHPTLDTGIRPTECLFGLTTDDLATRRFL
jgi:hypothetical protein